MNQYMKDLSSNHLLLTKDVLASFLNDFNSDVVKKELDNTTFSNFGGGKYISLIIRLLFEDSKWSTYDKVNLITSSEDINNLIIKLSDLYDSKNEYYKSLEITRILIEYKVKENTSDIPLHLISTVKNYKKNINNPKNKLKFGLNKINSLNIPNNKNYDNWGEIVYQSEYELKIKTENKNIYTIIKHSNYNEIEVRSNKNNILYKFEDHFITGAGTRQLFVRYYNNYEFYIDNNKEIIILKTLSFKTNHLKTIEKDKKFNGNKFLVLDIETMVKDNKHIPYCICFFDGSLKYSFYLDGYQSVDEMFFACFNSLFKPKYSGYNIYIHNLSKFDGIFLISNLIKFDNGTVAGKFKIDIKPIIRNGDMISIKIKFGKYNLTLLDSLLLLPTSLSKLTNSFNIKNTKTTFPYNFLNDNYNKNIDLNYIGPIPPIFYFNDDKDEYNKFISELDNSKINKWSLKNESINYCLNDCIGLYQVIEKFNEFIFNKFNLNIHNYPTLPSLTFAIFRSNYLDKLHQEGYYIPLIKGEMYDDLKDSYTGGSTDMFVPSSEPNEKVYGYDVNSLYPTSMSSGMFMPVLSKKNMFINYFEATDPVNLKDLKKYFKKIKINDFGFFDVNIETTKILKHPVLQIKHDTGHGLRTISPLGKWKSMYFSPELLNTNKLNLGYNYTINRGYLFEKHEVFANFIKDLYKIKQSVNKNDPWYLISKLLMNSLYGKFGMDPNYTSEKHSIVNMSEFNNYELKYTILNYQIIEDKFLVSYIDSDINNNINNNSKQTNVSVVISSAITAYARIFMSRFKNNGAVAGNFKLFYTDT